MEFYSKIEPAGEFATGIFNINDHGGENPDVSEICEIQMDENAKNDVVRTFGLPIYTGESLEDLEEDTKDVVLGLFIDMPEEGRDKINWEVDIRKPKRDIGCDENGVEVPSKFIDYVANSSTIPECFERSFAYSEYSKYSVDMDFGENPDLSKLYIRIAYCKFHNIALPDEIYEMWVLESIEYDDENDEGEYPEWEMFDRGVDLSCKVVDFDGEEYEIED